MTMNAPFTLRLIVLVILLGYCSGLQAATAAKPPIRIAAIFALTGPAAAANSPGVTGTRLAIDTLNSQGGLLGRPLSLIVLDNQSTPIGSRLAAEEAVRQGVVAIIGAQWSSHSLAIAPVAQQANTPMISPISTVSRLTAVGNAVFRVCFTDDFQGKILAGFAGQDLRAKRATILINLHSDFSMDIAKVFKKTFEANGGRVIREIEYKPLQIDYDYLINLTRAEPADVLLLSGHDESGPIALALQKAQIPGVLLGTDGWDAPSFFQTGGNRLQQAYYTTHWSKDSTNPLSQNFVRHYPANIPEPSAPAALAYDAVNVLAAAIRQAGTDERQVVRTTLAGITAYPGITGTISFDAKGNTEKTVVINEITNGRTRLLKTISPP